MTLIWVTGSPGAGKSTVCAQLSRLGQTAMDVDWAGLCRWEERSNGVAVEDPPYPVPVGWLDRYGWNLVREPIERLAAEAAGEVIFLCGSAENEADVRDLFDRIVCLVVDDTTMIDRLRARTSNAFGAHPEELAAALRWNASQADRYHSLGATLVDATADLEDVVKAVLAATAGR